MNPMLHIRKNVFAITQVEMAEIAGTTQGSVSKWENGSYRIVPDRNEMERIRAEAACRSLEWDDRWFFEVPEAAE
jgi:transcriptional regulator with XRE-family HTH domain